MCTNVNRKKSESSNVRWTKYLNISVQFKWLVFAYKQEATMKTNAS